MLNGPGLIGFEWAMVGFTLILVLMRLYARCFITRNISGSDVMVLFTWLLFAIGVTEDHITYCLGFFHGDVLAYTVNLLDSFDDKQALVKILQLSLLLFYYKLIPNTLLYLRLALHITSVVIGISFIIVILLNTFWCLPVSRNWSVDKSLLCYSYAAFQPYFVSAALHLLTEFMLLALPFPLLKYLQLSKRKKIEVGILFALGGLTIIFTIVRVIVLGLSVNAVIASIWSTVEQVCGMIVVCAPALRVYIASILPSSQVGAESAGNHLSSEHDRWWQLRRRGSGAAHEMLRFPRSHHSENAAWECLPDKQTSVDNINVSQREVGTDIDVSTSSEDLKTSSSPVEAEVEISVGTAA
ncbi:hypothetical protein Dda_4821 [Drechslerella dactyloides]|uniref:Rhodopsin domain-containing protein n=1 Tax=Drechslerella dactyloides TaxID=74499 RepID=A0AAD6IZV3_DREDA|nr:hypothetical protein Dda_4821 [Drechslerella dactyloides]